jgi:Holliday junction resolvasome RuvABC DNA-binding subunit
MSLIKSNRTAKELQPEKTASVKDFENKPAKKATEVTFNTNLKITNHSRNKLQALMTLGYTQSQKDAIDLLFQSYREQLDADSRKELDLQIKTLERRDARLKG